MSELQLEKNDLRYIGGAVYQNEGNCVFVFYDAECAYGVERIFLRNLLKLFGEDYVILSEEESWDDEDEVSMHVFTNFPWDVYMNALMSND